MTPGSIEMEHIVTIVVLSNGTKVVTNAYTGKLPVTGGSSLDIKGIQVCR